MRGVFFSYIDITDSRRDSFFTYFGKRGVTAIEKITGRDNICILGGLRI